MVLKMTQCPNCEVGKTDRLYLCPSCWRGLSQKAQHSLLKRDRYAMDRLRQLYDQVHNDVPLSEIKVTA